MTKYVYVIYKVDLKNYEIYYDDIHKIFSTEEAAKAYLKQNHKKVFPANRKIWDRGWGLSSEVLKVVLEE